MRLTIARLGSASGTDRRIPEQPTDRAPRVTACTPRSSHVGAISRRRSRDPSRTPGVTICGGSDTGVVILTAATGPRLKEPRAYRGSSRCKPEASSRPVATAPFTWRSRRLRRSTAGSWNSSAPAANCASSLASVRRGEAGAALSGEGRGPRLATVRRPCWRVIRASVPYTRRAPTWTVGVSVASGWWARVGRQAVRGQRVWLGGRSCLSGLATSVNRAPWAAPDPLSPPPLPRSTNATATASAPPAIGPAT
jgi:hypothetical protein